MKRFLAGLAAVVGIVAGIFAIQDHFDKRPKPVVIVGGNAGGYTNGPASQATLPGQQPTFRAQPANTTAPTGAACLIGTWREVRNQATINVGGQPVMLVSSGGVQVFGADTASLRPATTAVGSANGHRYQMNSNEFFAFTYLVYGSTAYYTPTSATGSQELFVDGQPAGTSAAIEAPQQENFSCEGDRLVQDGEYWHVELARVTG
jgi:hypothetical protein